MLLANGAPSDFIDADRPLKRKLPKNVLVDAQYVGLRPLGLPLEARDFYPPVVRAVRLGDMGPCPTVARTWSGCQRRLPRA